MLRLEKMVLFPRELEADLLYTVWPGHRIPDFIQPLASRLFIYFLGKCCFLFNIAITQDLDSYISLLAFQGFDHALDVYAGPSSSSQHAQDQTLLYRSKQGVQRPNTKCYFYVMEFTLRLYNWFLFFDSFFFFF